MSFRDDDDARLHHIDALEDELSERDAEIARLRAQLEADRDFFGDDAPPTPEVSNDLPSGDVWSVDTHDRYGWAFGLGWLVLFASAGAYAWSSGLATPVEILPIAIFGLPGLAFFVRSRLVLDRSTGAVTRIQSFAFLSRKRTEIAGGRPIVMKERYVSPKDGASYYVGHVFLGDTKLFAKKSPAAEELAKRVAAFLGLPFVKGRDDARTLEKRALLPLLLTMLGTLVFLAIYLIWKHPFAGH